MTVRPKTNCYSNFKKKNGVLWSLDAIICQVFSLKSFGEGKIKIKDLMQPVHGAWVILFYVSTYYMANKQVNKAGYDEATRSLPCTV